MRSMVYNFVVRSVCLRCSKLLPLSPQTSRWALDKPKSNFVYIFTTISRSAVGLEHSKLSTAQPPNLQTGIWRLQNLLWLRYTNPRHQDPSYWSSPTIYSSHPPLLWSMAWVDNSLPYAEYGCHSSAWRDWECQEKSQAQGFPWSGGVVCNRKEYWWSCVLGVGTSPVFG